MAAVLIGGFLGFSPGAGLALSAYATRKCRSFVGPVCDIPLIRLPLHCSGCGLTDNRIVVKDPTRSNAASLIGAGGIGYGNSNSLSWYFEDERTAQADVVLDQVVEKG